MKRSLRIVVLATLAYASIVYLTRGILPESTASTITILVVPIALVAVILYVDLRSRARTPTVPEAEAGQLKSDLGREVQQLSRRIIVATGSSSDYYEKVILARMREILVERASIETGIAVEKARTIFSRPNSARDFLRDDELWKLLYYHGKSRGSDRRKMLSRLVQKIGDWSL